MKFRAQDAILILISAIFSLAFFPTKWGTRCFYPPCARRRRAQVLE